jgi:hypothetical protein
VRKRDVLTLGLAAPSRRNPLYRRWARRRTTQSLTVALKALTLRYGTSRGGNEQTLVLTADEIERASRSAGLLEPLFDGGIRLRVDPTVEPPESLRILWDLMEESRA